MRITCVRVPCVHACFAWRCLQYLEAFDFLLLQIDRLHVLFPHCLIVAAHGIAAAFGVLGRLA